MSVETDRVGVGSATDVLAAGVGVFLVWGGAALVTSGLTDGDAGRWGAGAASVVLGGALACVFVGRITTGIAQRRRRARYPAEPHKWLDDPGVGAKRMSREHRYQTAVTATLAAMGATGLLLSINAVVQASRYDVASPNAVERRRAVSARGARVVAPLVSLALLAAAAVQARRRAALARTTWTLREEARVGGALVGELCVDRAARVELVCTHGPDAPTNVRIDVDATAGRHRLRVPIAADAAASGGPTGVGPTWTLAVTGDDGTLHQFDVVIRPHGASAPPSDADWREGPLPVAAVIAVVTTLGVATGLPRSSAVDADNASPTAASSASPGDLGRQIRRSDTRFAAAEQLVAMGRDAAPTLLDALADADPETRRAAAMAFARPTFPVEATDEPALERALSDPSHNVVGHALTALKKLGPAAAPAVPRLTQMLDDERGSQDHVAHVLAAIGPAAAQALPSLERLAANGRAHVRPAAQSAIHAIKR